MGLRQSRCGVYNPLDLRGFRFYRKGSFPMYPVNSPVPLGKISGGTAYLGDGVRMFFSHGTCDRCSAKWIQYCPLYEWDHRINNNIEKQRRKDRLEERYEILQCPCFHTHSLDVELDEDDVFDEDEDGVAAAHETHVHIMGYDVTLTHDVNKRRLAIAADSIAANHEYMIHVRDVLYSVVYHF